MGEKIRRDVRLSRLPAVQERERGFTLRFENVGLRQRPRKNHCRKLRGRRAPTVVVGDGHVLCVMCNVGPLCVLSAGCILARGYADGTQPSEPENSRLLSPGIGVWVA